MIRVLITGMSASGKSTLIDALAARGFKAIDTSWNPEWEDPPPNPNDGPGWVWREDRINQLLDREDSPALFVAATVENQGRFYPRFDHIVLLSVTEEITRERLASRAGNPYGKRPDELAQVLQYKHTVEPLLRRGATVEIDTAVPVSEVLEQVLELVQVARDSIASARLVLEPVDHRHARQLEHAVQASMTELVPWMPWAPGHTMQTQNAFIERALEGWTAGSEYHFAVCERRTAIGTVGLKKIEPRVFEIGYWMRSDRTGRGYTTEAAQAVLKFAFESLAARRVLLNAGAANHASTRVAEKLGFERVGDVPGGMEGGEGKTFPAFAHELSRERWRRENKTNERNPR